MVTGADPEGGLNIEVEIPCAHVTMQEFYAVGLKCTEFRKK